MGQAELRSFGDATDMIVRSSANLAAWQVLHGLTNVRGSFGVSERFWLPETLMADHDFVHEVAVWGIAMNRPCLDTASCIRRDRGSSIEECMYEFV